MCIVDPEKEFKVLANVYYNKMSTFSLQIFLVDVPYLKNMSMPGGTDAKYILDEKMTEDIPDLPSGPLDIYRRKASFDWKDMMRFLEGEEVIAFKVGYFYICCISLFGVYTLYLKRLKE